MEEKLEFKLVFSEWNCGHDGITPDSIDVRDGSVSLQIVEAMSHVMTEGGSFKGQLISRETQTVLTIYQVTADRVYWENA